MPVRVDSAALFLRLLSGLCWALIVDVETVDVLKSGIDPVTTEECLKDVVDKETFDDASSDRTVVTRVSDITVGNDGVN
jgi:hypothetical protein